MRASEHGLPLSLGCKIGRNALKRLVLRFLLLDRACNFLRWVLLLHYFSIPIVRLELRLFFGLGGVRFSVLGVFYSCPCWAFGVCAWFVYPV